MEILAIALLFKPGHFVKNHRKGRVYLFSYFNFWPGHNVKSPRRYSLFRPVTSLKVWLFSYSIFVDFYPLRPGQFGKSREFYHSDMVILMKLYIMQGRGFSVDFILSDPVTSVKSSYISDPVSLSKRVLLFWPGRFGKGSFNFWPGHNGKKWLSILTRSLWQRLL